MSARDAGVTLTVTGVTAVVETPPPRRSRGRTKRLPRPESAYGNYRRRTPPTRRAKRLAAAALACIADELPAELVEHRPAVTDWLPWTAWAEDVRAYLLDAGRGDELADMVWAQLIAEHVHDPGSPRRT